MLLFKLKIPALPCKDRLAKFGIAPTCLYIIKIRIFLRKINQEGHAVSEEETRKLLIIREGIEKRIEWLLSEVRDLRKAVDEIDKLIVRKGFRKPIAEIRSDGARTSEEGDMISLKAKDGALLGYLEVKDRDVFFKPVDDIIFTISTPPFQSFLLDRVLANMKSSDEELAVKGEINSDDGLSYDVSTDGERLLGLVVHNYGGERRLREIRSSLRWALDKMYENIKKS